MKRLIVASLLSMVAGFVITGTVLAQSAPEFKLGFKALADQLPTDVVGTPVENEYFNVSNGNSEQHTTKGLMVWRKIDNWTAYTNGYMTWINGPNGVQSRLNTDRFDWEKDPQAPAPQPAPQPAPAPARTWSGIDKSADGFKISLPSPWQQVDLNSPDLVGEFTSIFKDYPNSSVVAQEYATIAGMLKLTKGVFFGFPVTPEFAANPESTFVKILKVQVPSGTTLDSLSAQATTLLDSQAAQGTVSGLIHQRTTLPAGQAEEFKYLERMKLGLLPEVTFSVDEYAFVHNGYVYDVNFAATDSHGATELSQVADGIIRSFQFTN